MTLSLFLLAIELNTAMVVAPDEVVEPFEVVAPLEVAP